MRKFGMRGLRSETGGWFANAKLFLPIHLASRFRGVMATVCILLMGGIAQAVEVALIYTGDTQSFLEVCGCTEGQLGGVARRATVVRDVRRDFPNALLLDAGGLFAGDTVLDQLRCAVHLDAMRAMGYDAANVGADAFLFGRGFFDALRDTAGVPFVSANAEAPGVAPFSIFTSNGVTVGVIGLVGEPRKGDGMGMSHSSSDADSTRIATRDTRSALQRSVNALRDRVDALVVLCDLPRETAGDLVNVVPGVDAVIGARWREMIERVNGTVFLGTQPQGKAVGVATLTVANGHVQDVRARSIFISESIGEDRVVQGLVKGFYDHIGSHPELQAVGRPRFEGFALEEQVSAGQNGYVGAQVCQGCHESAYAAWKESPHAGAYNRLLQQQKHVQPDCVMCHTTGFGYPTGFRIAQDAGSLVDVQCEVCHGPGGQHARRPEPRNIRGTPSKDLCQRCHDADQTPDFDVDYEQMLDIVRHDDPGLSTEVRDALERSEDGRPLVELFVMADCPYGIRAEQALAPVIRDLGDRIDFRLYFIADEVGVDVGETVEKQAVRQGPGCTGTATSGTGRFRSLHGDPEIEEGIRQLVVRQVYPDRYWDYILCRNQAGIGADWEACVQKVGLDAVTIADGVRQSGVDLFSENIRRANVLGIHASPTLRVNGREVTAFFDPMALSQAICRDGADSTFCAQVPECSSDRDCRQPGQVGVCVDANTPAARCVFRQPVSFEVTIVNDSTCAVCETYPFVRSTLALFPGVQYRTVEAQSAVGQALIAQYGLDRVPSFVLGGAFEQTVRFDRFARTVRRVSDGFVPDVRMTPISRLLNGRQELARLDAVLDLENQASLDLAVRLLRWAGEVNAPDRVRMHFVGKGVLDRTLRWLQVTHPNKVGDVLLCRAFALRRGDRDLALEDCLQRGGIAVEGLNGDDELRAQAIATARSMGIAPEAVPSVVIDGTVVLATGALARLEEIFYRLNPDLASRDRNASRSK